MRLTRDYNRANAVAYADRLKALHEELTAQLRFLAPAILRLSLLEDADSTFAADGQLVSVAKARGRQQVTDKLVEMAVSRCGSHRKYNLAVANGGDRPGMEKVREKLTAALSDYLHLWDGEIDSTLSVYIGDGILGAAVQTLD